MEIILIAVVAAIVAMCGLRSLKRYMRKLHMQKMDVSIYWNTEAPKGGTVVVYIDQDGAVKRGHALMSWTDRHTVWDRVELIQAVVECRGDRRLESVILDGAEYGALRQEDRRYFVKAA